MNFKRFNGSTWETVRHKRYGSGTEQLASFPAMIQASGEALTDYTIYGNTVQDGTPTTEAPVEVVGCGDWDATSQQYKLPLAVNGTGYPIYLGQVPTARSIKKLVLTGHENWIYRTGSPPDVYFTEFIGAHFIDNSALCTHYQNQDSGIFDELSDKHVLVRFAADGSKTFIGFRDSNFPYSADFKSYLAAQYANGTPVTVWYVLAEPETAIVNEPLHKIGDYADTITMAQAEVAIPTSDGDNIISFGTTVKPSAMSATFKGWHPVQGAKQYDGSEWR